MSQPPADAGKKLQEFVPLYTRNARRIYTYLLTLLPNWADAEEVFQDVGAILWEKFESFEPGTNFAAWACRIAHFEVLNRRKRRLPQLFTDLVIDNLDPERLATDDHAEAEYHALADCFAKLPTQDRELLELRYSGGVAPQQIAAQLERPIKLVYKSLARVRKSLLECVQRTLLEEPKA